MQLPLSTAAAARLVVLDRVGSTNTELIARATAALEPEFSVLATADQTAGRGRLGREWVAPPGATLAVSVLLRPVLPAGEPLGLEHYGWLPLIAGLSMTSAVASVLPEPTRPRVGLKWPNDVLIGGLKAGGILTELLPDHAAVVVGSGVNLAMTAEQLPTPTSTSLSLAGATLSGDDLADAVLSRYLELLREYYGDFVRHGADPTELLGLLDEQCTTLGQQVRVELPGGDTIVGTATGIDGTGRLQVRRSSDGRSLAVAAGDVTHLRYE